MLRIVAIALVGLVLCVLPCATATATGQISARYLGVGLQGHLELMGAGGSQFAAIDSAGRLVAGGLAPLDLYVVPVFGAAPGPLTVYVGEDVQLQVDRDGWWE